jgi:hypothetical protein
MEFALSAPRLSIWIWVGRKSDRSSTSVERKTVSYRRSVAGHFLKRSQDAICLATIETGHSQNRSGQIVRPDLD